jgi:hypothetical protein
MIDLRIASPFYGIDFAQKYWRKCGIDWPRAVPLALAGQLPFAPVPSLSRLA